MRSSSPLPFERNRRRTHGLSLIEVLVTLTIVLMILVAVLAYVSSVERSWKFSADPFVEAGDAFETLTRHLAGATLESYPDYADTTGAFRIDPSSGFVPDHLARRSDLTFVCGPSSGTSGLLTTSGRTTSGSAVFFVERQGYTQTEANSGLIHVLNATGYFVEFSDESALPGFLPLSFHRWRWRLKQVMQPSEALQVYAAGSSAAWIQPLVATESTTPVLADNIIMLIVLPERGANDPGVALSPDFCYDSRDPSNPLTRHQLPPRVRLAMMAIDETSAQLLANHNGSSPPTLVPAGLLQQAAKLDADLSQLDAALTVRKIGHRLYQREISLPAAAWSNTLSQ